MAIKIPESIQTKSMYELIHLAYVDNLTGVGNRNLLEEMREEFENADYFFVAIVDVDGLKAHNDCWGHESGDQLLKFIALDLQKAAQLVFRLGGDEFLLIDNFDMSSALSSIPNISYGIVVRKACEDLYWAMRHADVKMYEMKNKHRKEREYGYRFENAQTRNSSE